MKKSLLLATLLLSSAAQADVYFCSALQYAETLLSHTITISDDEFNSNERDRNTFSVFVDTDKGTTRPNTDNYQGECTQDDGYVKCEKESSSFDFRRLVINKITRSFTEVYQNYRSAVGFSISGTCVQA